MNKKNYITQYINGDIMNKYDLWLLFTKTGKIEYYLKYKNYKEQDNDKKNWRYSS